MSPILKLALPAAAGLVLVIAWEGQGGVAPAAAALPAPPHTVPLSDTTPATESGDITRDWVATILARPLFRDNRRPVADAGVALASRGDDQARLSGVVTGPFGNRAIFISAGSPKPIVVEVGGRISGAIVRTIEPGRVVVESGGGVRTLTPAFADAKPVRRR